MQIVDPLGRIELNIMLAKDAVERMGEAIPFIARVTALASARQRLVLALAIDASPSMDGERIFFAKSAAIKLIEILEPGDVLMIIGFCKKPFLVYGPRTIETQDQIKEARRKIAAIKTCPGTNIADTLVYTITLLKEELKSGGIGRILLITDGEPTVGEKKPDKIEEKVFKALGESEIPIVAIGVGSEYNESLLLRLADATNGDLEHISDVDHLEEVIVKEAVKAAQVVAQNVELLLTTPPGVEARFYGRRFKATEEGYVVDIGFLSSGEVEDIAGELIVAEPGTAGVTVSFKVRYTDPQTQVVIESSSLTARIAVGKPSYYQKVIASKVEMIKSSEQLKKAILSKNYKEAVQYLREIAEASLSIGSVDLREKTIDILELIEKGEVEEGAKRAATLARKLSRGGEA